VIDTAASQMANRTLVNSYLRSARQAHPDSNAGRLAFLQAAVSDLDAAIQSGDWEVTSTAFSGSSNSTRRNLSAIARVAAIEEAITILTNDPDATKKTAGPLFARFPDLYNPD
jgi:hypothetical protein